VGLHFFDCLAQADFLLDLSLLAAREFNQSAEIGLAPEFNQQASSAPDNVGILFLIHEFLEGFDLALQALLPDLLLLFVLRELVQLLDRGIFRVSGAQRLEQRQRFREFLRGQQGPGLDELLLLFLLGALFFRASE